jgi:hypothetical protein
MFAVTRKVNAVGKFLAQDMLHFARIVNNRFIAHLKDIGKEPFRQPESPDQPFSLCPALFGELNHVVSDNDEPFCFQYAGDEIDVVVFGA